MSRQFEASKPIYMQIAEHVFQDIVRGDVAPGDKLPSVREMAVETGVNPNTIQRSYSEMERLGVVETRRGQGTFVIEDKEIVSQLKERLQHDIMNNFVKSLMELGYNKEDMITGLKHFLEGEHTDDD